MIKKCKFCGKEREMKGKRRYCNSKCKKAFENSLRGGGHGKTAESPSIPMSEITKPPYLTGEGGEYWDKVAPILLKRGHLNAISEDVFIELCDLVQRLRDINKAINAGTTQQCGQCGAEVVTPGNRSLLQIDDKWDNRTGIESQSFKESALSDIKRKYSRLLLDYCKQFYLTPLSNRGNFGISVEEEDPLDKFIKGQNGKKE